jgi:DNA-binding beta-propeller fold protein YncE
MDTAWFDHFTRVIATTRSRRALTQTLAALPVASAGNLLVEEALARRWRRRNRTQAEKKKKKKAQFCLNGLTITASASKKSKKRLRNQGAVSGACPSAPACSPPCPSNQRCCGGSCVSSSWTNQTTFGTSGSGPSNFSSPFGLSLTPDARTALVADRYGHRAAIWTRPNASSSDWSPQATFGSIGSSTIHFAHPHGAAITPDGLTALIADTSNHRISVWKRSGPGSTDWVPEARFGSEGAGEAQLKFPRGITLSPDGLTAYVADRGNNRVSVWTRPGATRIDWSPQSRFGSGPGSANNQFNNPNAVTASPDGLTAWVADGSNHRISVWSRPNRTSGWSPVVTFGNGGSFPNQFNVPSGVAVSPDILTAWVSDRNNSRIAVWSRTDAGSTVWTSVTSFGTQGGGATNLHFPEDIAITADGLTALSADSFNARIAVWTLPCPA